MASSSMSGGGRRPRAEENRKRIRRKPLNGGTDHDRRRIVTQEQLEHAHDSNAYDLALYEANQDAQAPGNPAPSPYVPPPGGDQPSQSSHNHGNRPGSQSSGQSSSSKSDEQNDTGSDKSDNETKSQKQASSQPSTPDLPPDIEWSPEDEPSGIVPFAHAAAQGTRDSSEDKTTAVCEALYAADREAVARGLKIMTGCEPDEEQDVLPAFIRLAHNVGMDEYLTGVEAWYTTRLGPTESLAASSGEEESLSDQAQVATDAGNSEEPELNRRLRYSLTESDPGEWDASFAEKEDLENVLLIPKLKRLIHGFDEDSVNWGDFTLQESIDFYLRQIAGELHAASVNPTVSEEYFRELQAEYAWAADLQALAKPIPLDDATAYAEVFDVGAEGERTHVQNQLAVIYKFLEITPTDDYFASQSTADLKYELYSLLIHNVIPLRGSDQDPLAAKLFRSYSQVAGVSPQDAVDRLQGTYREPDVLGFLFVMGLTVGSMVFEPLDWALTTVDVINALSEGDIESAVGNFILGVVPLASSRMDDAFRLVDNLGVARRGGPLGNMSVYFANPVGKGRPAGLHSRNVLAGRSFDDKAIDIFEYRGGTGPGIGAKTHEDLLAIRRDNLLEPKGPNAQDGHIIQNRNFEILRDQYGYNIISRPDRSQLERIEYYTRTDADGLPIDSMRKNPDFIIEGRVFDHYAAFVEDEYKALLNIWYTVGEKVPLQTDRLAIDLSNTSLTPEHLINELNDELNKVDVPGQSSINPGFKDLKEVLIMKNGKYAGTWVNPQF